MRGTESALERLNRAKSGLWGFTYPVGTKVDLDLIEDLTPKEYEFRSICIEKRVGQTKLPADENRQTIDIATTLKSMAEDAEASDRNALRLLVWNFHNASDNEQSAMMKNARAAQHTLSIAAQIVFAGSWSYFAFRDAYRRIHGHTNSPPAQSKDVINLTPWTVEDVIELLIEKQRIGMDRSEMDLVAANFLIEQTGGDEFLIHHAADSLDGTAGHWTDSIEQALDELSTDCHVVEEIAERLSSLDPPALTELERLLRAQALVRPHDSPVVEKLWLAGLARRERVHGGKLYVEIASPIVNRVIRSVLANKNQISFQFPTETCWKWGVISSVLYRKVAEVENLLRNVLMTEWFIQRGDSWPHNLESTKVRAREIEEEADLFMALVARVNPAVAESAVSQGGSSISKVTALESARDWQCRQRESHAVELLNDNLMHFLTTENLVNALLGKKNGLHGEGKPFTKDFLAATLQDYVLIRAAVAHNQPVKLATVSRLNEIQRTLAVNLTNFADRVGLAPTSPRFE